jgi:hypothetical protein
MGSIANDLMEQVVERLRADPPLLDDITRIRRDHRTILTRDDCPAIHVIDGTEEPKSTKACIERAQVFTVAVFVRDDAGYAAADPLKLEVMRRLNPQTQAWQAGVDIVPGRIAPNTEIADLDALRLDMEFTFRYATGLWALDATA